MLASGFFILWTYINWWPNNAFLVCHKHTGFISTSITYIKIPSYTDRKAMPTCSILHLRKRVWLSFASTVTHWSRLKSRKKQRKKDFGSLPSPILPSPRSPIMPIFPLLSIWGIVFPFSKSDQSPFRSQMSSSMKLRKTLLTLRRKMNYSIISSLSGMKIAGNNCWRNADSFLQQLFIARMDVIVCTILI